MSPSPRQQIVSAVESLLSRPIAQDELPAVLGTIGALSRVAQGDDDEGLADRADELLARCTTELAPVFAGSMESVKLPSLTPVRRWLQAPWGAFSHVIDTLDRAGAIAAGLEVVAPSSSRTTQITNELSTLAADVARISKREGGVMVDAAMAAATKITSHGVAPGADDVLISLSDVLAERIEASLRGEPIDVPAPVRARVLAQDEMSQLSSVLSKALQAPSLSISPDLLEMAWPLATARSADVFLHGEAVEALPSLPETEVAAGIHAQFIGGELVVRFDESPTRGAFLIPLRSGTAGSALRPREGATSSQIVFELGDAQNAEAMALVVGDLVVLIRKS